MKQIICIHGGDAFNSQEEWLAYLQEKKFDFEWITNNHPYWHQSLRPSLGEDYQVALPQMPNKQNAHYSEWKVWFEKMFPFLTDDIILIGHSLGGIFLAKYLAENNFPKKIAATMLVAAPYDDESMYSLGDFRLPADLSKLAAQGGHIYIYQSEDDPVVPFNDCLKYQKALPGATARIFKDRQHFNQETFAELIDDIKKL